MGPPCMVMTYIPQYVSEDLMSTQRYWHEIFRNMYLWRLYEEMLKLDSFICSLSDLELSKMTLRNLGPQALVSRNICHQQHQFLMRGLEDMSLDSCPKGQPSRLNGDSMLPPQKDFCFTVSLTWTPWNITRHIHHHRSARNRDSGSIRIFLPRPAFVWRRREVSAERNVCKN
jgi:hypothetical protein